MKTGALVLLLFALSVAYPLNLSTAFDDKHKNESLYEKKGDKERIYNVTFEEMGKVCMKAASEENVVEFSDRETGILTYKSGMSMASWGFRISVSLTKVEDNRTRVKLTTQKTRGQLVAWGAGGRTVNKFFDGVDKLLLKDKTEPTNK
jgi:hypothetical protein